MEDLLPWLTLKSVPGIGDLLCKRLIDRYQSPERVFKANPEDLLETPGMTPRLTSAILNYRAPDRLRQEIDLAVKRKYQIVTMTDPQYPALLREIPDPPLFLYCYGTLDGQAACLAVVGSRKATSYGLATTRKLCAEVASYGVTIVSGMARGIDSAAHEGALSGGGKTIAVLGSGLEQIYPPENRKLFHQIAENGAAISEFSLAKEPLPHHFPKRNRIIAGMSLGTVIVEAARKSGSLITARLAADQGREVFAVPGSIESHKSAGTHALIKQGAKLVENAGDILEEIGHFLNVKPPTDKHAEKGPASTQHPLLPPEAVIVLDALEPYPIHIDDLVRKLAMDPGKLAGILLMLEVEGLVRQLPGKQFIRSGG